MKIQSLANFNSGYSAKNTSKANKQSSQPISSNVNFGAYKLIGKFKDPNYTWVENFVYELSNKMKVIIVPKTGPDAISVNNNIKTGAINEIDKIRGGSHLFEHLTVQDGSKDYAPGVLSKTMEAKGAKLNAHTGFNRTAYFFSITNPSKTDLSSLLHVQANSIIYPKPPIKSFNKEKNVVIQEIKQSADSPFNVTFSALIKNLFGLKADADNLILGNIKDIENISKKDILQYHKNTYTPDSTEMYIAGAVDPKKIIKEIDKLYDVPAFKPALRPKHFEVFSPTETTKVSYHSSPKINTSFITVGFAGPQNSDAKGIIASKILGAILTEGRSARLSSKLLNALNTEPSFMFMNVGNHPKSPNALLFDFSSLPSGSEQKVFDVFGESISELKTKPITQEELDIAKNSLLDSFNSEAETSAGITALLEDFSNQGGIDAYKNFVKNTESITLQDVNDAVKYFDPNKSAITILQPTKPTAGVSFTGKALISSKSIKKYVLPNNVKLVINDTADKIRTVASMQIQSQFKEKPGAGIILTTILENSTARHSSEEFALLKAKAGVNSIAINNIENGLSIGAASRKEFFPGALKIMKEMVFEPAINQKNFDLAKDEILQILSSIQPSSEHRALEVMYGHNHPEGQTARYMKHAMQDLTLQDVQEYYANLMKDPSISATITGPISKLDGLNEAIIKEFSSIEGKFSNKNSKNTKIDVPKNNQVVVQLDEPREQSNNLKLFHIDTNEIKDFASMAVLDDILGSGLTSRLFLDLREKQKLAYNVRSTFNNCGTYAQESLTIKTGIKDSNGEVSDNLTKSLKGFEKHLEKFVNTLPTETELQRAKSRLRNKYTEYFATASGLNSALVEGATTKFGLTYYNKMLKEIDNISAQDVQDIAKKFLTKPSVTSVLTTEEALNKSRKYLETLGELKVYTKEEL